MTQTTTRRLLLLALAALLAPSCGPGEAPQPIDEKRILAEPRPEQRVAANTRSRFGPLDGSDMSPHGGEPGRVESPAAPGYAWDLPQGWKELAPTPLRTGNFTVPGRDHLECYVTVLPGGGGGVTANLSRWRKQMGLPPVTDADVDALPRVKMLGTDAPFLLMDGTYTGAGAAATSAGYTMAAAAIEGPGAAIFVKMVGPAADVRAELDNFKAVCASLRETGAAPHDDASGDFDPNSLRWTAPESWTKGPAKQMRLVTFSPKDKPAVECWISVLGGNGGGLEPNVNRWRSQLSLAPLSAEAFAALPTVKVLGRAARLVEIDGGALSMYGLVCELGTYTVFVKMTGPSEALRAERERFLAFCRSLS